MTFYDLHGNAVAYCENNETIYQYTGQASAYLYEDAVYSFYGRQLGWFENGWIRDLNGKCVFFTEDASGAGPVKPVKNVKPVKHAKHIKPVKHVIQVKKTKASKSLTWSNLSGTKFFA